LIHPETIDIEEYLDAKGVAYSPPGSKNVGKNSIGISCPFCGDHAYSGDNHLGIRLDSKIFSCWICGRTGNIFKLVMKLEECTFKQAVRTLAKYVYYDVSFAEKDTDVVISNSNSTISLPSYAKKELFSVHRKYLLDRGFDPDYIFNKYDLYCTGMLGKWKFRLIIPVYHKKKLVTFSSRDITDKSPNKYVHFANDLSIIPIKQTVYGIERALDIAVVVEGATDVWNIGDGTVCIWNKKASAQQIKQLINFKKVFIMLDSDAKDQVEELAYDVGAFTDTEIIDLSEGDPGDLTKEEVRYLRKQIF